ncbi:MAG: type I methionyl aminopeptidase [Planctomycetota bacterium]
MKTAATRIVLKSPREIELLRAAGRLVYEILGELESQICPGVTTAQLDATAADMIRAAGATPLFLGQKSPQARCPFPATLCTSVNEEIVHGVPGDRVLKAGDIISIDCGVRLKGYCGDAARTFAVGQVAPAARALMSTTREALELAINEIKPRIRWSQVARRMQKLIEGRGFGVVRDFVGHGIGREMHEEPKIPNYWERGPGNVDFELVPGMTLAIEPMVTGGRSTVTFGNDPARWTIVTKDGSLAAHFENMVAVTENGSDVLSNGS